MQPYTNHYPPDDYYPPDAQQPPDWIYVFMPSYSGKAFLAFILYFCGYLPGLVVNIAFCSRLSTRKIGLDDHRMD